MAVPQLIVEIAFATDYYQTPSWVDVSPYVRGVVLSRGRQRELDRFEAGTMTVILDNRDRRFDPTNTAGPYYPSIMPARRIRCRAVWQAVSYPLFDGLVESWQLRWPALGDFVTEVAAVDLFRYLREAQIVLSNVPAELSGQRIHRVLDAIGWPAAERAIDSGQSTIQGGSFAEKALEHIQKVADTEQGLFFMSAAGKATFKDRYSRFVSSTADYPTFGDMPNELPYTDIELHYTDDQLWNQIVVTRVGGTNPGVAQDTTSMTRFLTRSLRKENTLLMSDAAAQATAEYLLNKYKYPQYVITAITIRPEAHQALWSIALGIDLASLITVVRRPRGGTGIFSQLSFVEGLKWQIEKERWQLTLQLNQASTEMFWRLAGTDTDQYAESSRLEQTTRLAY